MTIGIENLRSVLKDLERLDLIHDKEKNSYEIEIDRLKGGIVKIEERLKEKDGIIKDLKELIDVIKLRSGKKEEQKASPFT